MIETTKLFADRNTTQVKVTHNNFKADRVEKQKLSRDGWHKGSENNTRNTHTDAIRKKFTTNTYISNSFFAINILWLVLDENSDC